MSERRSFGGQPREDVCCSISGFRHNESVRVDDLERGVETEGGCLKRDPVGSVDVGSPGVYKKTRRGCRGRGGRPRSNYVPVTLESLQIDKDVQERNRVAAEFRVSSVSERDLHEIDVEVGDVQVAQDSFDASDFGLNSLALGDSCLQSGNGAARHQVGELDRGVGSPFESLITRAVVFGEKQHGYSYVDLLDPSRVSEAVRILGSGPTLRRLLRLGPSWFKPVFELNRIYIEVGSYCGTVVSAPQCDAAYARFWAVVRTMPEMELQAGWNALVRQSNSVRCHVPCVAHPGYVLY